jgi:hypothetical protein
MPDYELEPFEPQHTLEPYDGPDNPSAKGVPPEDSGRQPGKDQGVQDEVDMLNEQEDWRTKSLDRSIPKQSSVYDSFVSGLEEVNKFLGGPPDHPRSRRGCY